MKTLAPILVLAALLCGCFSSGPGWKHESFAFARPDDPAALASTSTTNTIALGRVSFAPLFQSRAFTYRTGEDAYEQDPYAGFMVSPERAISGRLRDGLAVFGRVIEPGSAMTPTLTAEVSVNELYGDFRKADQPMGVMQLHLVVYQANEDSAGPVVFDKVFSHSTPLPHKTPDALMAAWDADLDAILHEVGTDYAKANSHDSGR